MITEMEFALQGSLDWYKQHLKNCFVPDDKKERVTNWCSRLLENKIRYQIVEQQCQVPWEFIGSIHGLESSFNFGTYLGNGDPLNRKTVHVPQGRGPFPDWESGCIDSLEYQKLIGRDWTLASMLQSGELFNGLGYLKHHPRHMSPYIWACTNFETKGMYVSDGKFDPEAISQQVGMAATFKQLIAMGAME
jgi:lysozyme family protein